MRKMAVVKKADHPSAITISLKPTKSCVYMNRNLEKGTLTRLFIALMGKKAAIVS
jgi:hypothetical protein